MRRVVVPLLACLIFLSDAGIVHAVTRSEALMAAMKSNEEQYSLPTGVLSKVARIESAGREDARNALTDAAGMFQWIPRSWYDATRRIYGAPKNLSDRYNGFIAIEVTAITFRDFLSNNRDLMRQANADPLPGLYACHFLGPAGCRKLFSLMIQFRDDPRPASTWFPKEARYNPAMFNGVTIMGFYNRLAQKMQAPGITNVVNGGAAFDGGPLAGRIMDQQGLVALQRPYTGAVPSQPTSLTYPSTFTSADNSIPADPQSPQQTPGANTGLQSAAHIIVHPKTASANDGVLVSWTSVGMQANSCMVQAGAVIVSQGHSEGSQRISIPSGASGELLFSLMCTSRQGAVVAAEAVVAIE